MRTFRTEVLDKLVSQTECWRVHELNELYTDLCDTVHALPADVTERVALHRVGCETEKLFQGRSLKIVGRSACSATVGADASIDNTLPGGT